MRHGTVYKGFDGKWFEFECEDCGYHVLLSDEERVFIDRGDFYALHSGGSHSELTLDQSRISQ